LDDSQKAFDMVQMTQQDIEAVLKGILTGFAGKDYQDVKSCFSKSKTTSEDI